MPILAGAVYPQWSAYKIARRVGDSRLLEQDYLWIMKFGGCHSYRIGETIIKICGSFLIVGI